MWSILGFAGQFGAQHALEHLARRQLRGKVSRSTSSLGSLEAAELAAADAIAAGPA
jgi:hypothetical protein